MWKEIDLFLSIPDDSPKDYPKDYSPIVLSPKEKISA